jgi:hypothetical protein
VGPDLHPNTPRELSDANTQLMHANSCKIADMHVERLHEDVPCPGAGFAESDHLLLTST